MRTEDLGASTEAAVGGVQAFLGLSRQVDGALLRVSHNRNAMKKASASAALNATLDGFFGPYNEQALTRKGLGTTLTS